MYQNLIVYKPTEQEKERERQRERQREREGKRRESGGERSRVYRYEFYN